MLFRRNDVIINRVWIEASDNSRSFHLLETNPLNCANQITPIRGNVGSSTEFENSGPPLWTDRYWKNTKLYQRQMHVRRTLMVPYLPVSLLPSPTPPPPFYSLPHQVPTGNRLLVQKQTFLLQMSKPQENCPIKFHISRICITLLILTLYTKLYISHLWFCRRYVMFPTVGRTSEKIIKN